jgi:nitroimidazol reductase NimA-like FMN-containing flavoprotein (pyridoxamine 5'-phosphate oxidase superfamily)
MFGCLAKPEDRDMSRRSGAPTERVRVKRLHERGAYDRTTIDAILDATPIAHVGYVFDGQPLVTPTLQWREGDHVYWHGSAASRMLETSDGADVCVTVTLIDGIVLARSAFHHSVNYRSVMLLGRASMVTDAAEKEARLKTFVDSMFPGRWDMLRPATAKELKATSVLSIPISEASAKVRTGPPKDDEEDYALDIWAGVLPLATQSLSPVDDPRLKLGLAAPDHVTRYRIG